MDLRRRWRGTRPFLDKPGGDPITAQSTEPNNRHITLRIARYGYPFSLLLFDLHKFKSVNDTYGHATGDEILRSAARASLETIRASDIPCRTGGNEFAIILPQTERPGSEVLAERIARKFAGYAHSLTPGAQVAIDYGIAVFPRKDMTCPARSFCADRKLYACKHQAHGRSADSPVPLPVTALGIEDPPARLRLHRITRMFQALPCPLLRQLP